MLNAYKIGAIGNFLIALSFKSFGVDFRVAQQQEEMGLDIVDYGEESYAERIGSPFLN